MCFSIMIWYGAVKKQEKWIPFMADNLTITNKTQCTTFFFNTLHSSKCNKQ